MYLRIMENEFGFYTDEIHIIEETDVEISQDDYERFFILQSEGNCFRLKSDIKNAKTLFEFVEMFEPERKQPAKLSDEAIKLEIQQLKDMIENLQSQIDL